MTMCHILLDNLNLYLINNYNDYNGEIDSIFKMFDEVNFKHDLWDQYYKFKINIEEDTITILFIIPHL